MSENNGARSYKGEVIGDSMAITINFKWLLQILALVGMLVYSYWQIETRIRDLENKIRSNIFVGDQLLITKKAIINMLKESINKEEEQEDELE